MSSATASDKIIVATTTFYKDLNDLRCHLASQTLLALRDAQIPTVVVDDSPEVIHKLFSAYQWPQVLSSVPGSTMGAGRRVALSQAGTQLLNDTDAAVWMEPEKHPLVTCLPDICAPIHQGHADLVIPIRNRTGMNSYPPLQMKYEEAGNATFELLTGKWFDVWFGPRAMNKKALKCFTEYDGKYGDRWESIFIPILTALHQGLRVAEVIVPYVHPPEQTAAESQDLVTGLDKRLDQLVTLVKALKAAYDHLQKFPLI